MSNTTVSVICYKSKTLSNGESPLMLRVCKDGKRSYRSLGLSVDSKYWSFSKNAPKPNCPDKELLLKLITSKKAELQNKILELKSDEKDYTASSLLNAEDIKFHLKTVEELYVELIDEYTKQGKCGNRLIYKGSYNSLKTFNKGKLDIPFSHIDVTWLTKYEKWLRGKKNKETTISLLFRTLRSAFNKAIERRYARKNDYPFDNYKISKFDTSTRKRAIPKSEILEIKDSLPLEAGQRQYMELSKDIFIFSYLCGGINFTDIANLTKDNIINGRIHYTRQKTGKAILDWCNDGVTIDKVRQLVECAESIEELSSLYRQYSEWSRELMNSYIQRRHSSIRDLHSHLLFRQSVNRWTVSRYNFA